MKKLYLCIFITVFFIGVLHAEDTPYMKLIDSHKGIDKMMVCLPMIQKTADNYKKAIQISIKKDSIDVQEYLNKEDNPPYKFKSFHGLMKGYREAVLVKMVGEWWIAVRMPEDEEAKKKYQKNHIANKAVGLLHGISYTLYEPYLKKCGDEFNQLAKENDLIKKYIELLNKKVEEEIYGSIVKAQIVEDKKEQPKYFVCENKNRKPLYVKFHKTDKVYYDYKKGKIGEWVKVKNLRRNKVNLDGVIPTLEVHEDKSRFENIIFKKKIFPIYVSDKYYVFYQEVNDTYWFGGDIDIYARHIIMDRFNLNILDYQNQKIINLYVKFKYDDAVIEKLFKESNQDYVNQYETVEGIKTFKGRRKLTNYKCSEIKQKI